MRIPNLVLTAFVCTMMSACSLTPSLKCANGLQSQIQESLYFGTGTPDGFVTKEQWTSFLQKSVTPKFPDGLTVVDASGQWQGKNGVIVKEPSYILTLIHNNSQQNITNINEIINTYKTQFQQESVLRVQYQSCVSF